MRVHFSSSVVRFCAAVPPLVLSLSLAVSAVGQIVKVAQPQLKVQNKTTPLGRRRPCRE